MPEPTEHPASPGDSTSGHDPTPHSHQAPALLQGPPLDWPGVAWVQAGPHQLWRGPVRKKIAPHQPGAGRWVQRFGQHLVCVRYRDDEQRQRRVVTVELLVDERPLPQLSVPTATPSSTIAPEAPASPPLAPAPAPAMVPVPATDPTHTWVGVRIVWGSRDLARRARLVGGVWDRQVQLWVMTRAQAEAANLQAYITEAAMPAPQGT